MLRQKDWSAILHNLRERRFEKFTSSALRYLTNLTPHDGFEVMNENWQNLIILDACRFDVFREVNWLDGELEKKISKGTTTQQWLSRNFTEYYEDVVYISANAFVNPYKGHDASYLEEPFNASQHFSEIFPVFMDDKI